jgi:hypothetical protein
VDEVDRARGPDELVELLSELRVVESGARASVGDLLAGVLGCVPGRPGSTSEIDDVAGVAGAELVVHGPSVPVRAAPVRSPLSERS